MRLSLFLLFFTPLALSQNVSFLFSVVSVEGPSGFASPNCSEGDVRSLVFSDPRNLDGWIRAASWNSFGVAPENETLITVRNVTLNSSECLLDLFNPGSVLDQVLSSVNGTWDFHLFVMPTIADLASAGVNCSGPDVRAFGPVGFVFRCFAPADYARAFVLGEGSYRRTSALCPCPASPVFANCTNETCSDAGDVADVLQGGDELDRTLNAPNREAVLGNGTWLLVFSNVLEIDGVFEVNLTDLATGPPNETLALKIKSPDESEWIYVSCRSPDTVFYDDGTGSNNSTMFHIHTVPAGAVPLFSEATLETFLEEGEHVVVVHSVSNDTDLTFIITRNPVSENVCSVLLLVEGFVSANGTLGGAVFDGPSVQPVFAGLFESPGESLILETDERYLPGRAFASFGALTEPNPDLPGPLGDSPVRRLTTSTFEERVRDSAILDDSDGTTVGTWTNISDPSGAFSGFFLETREANSSVSFDFPVSLHGPRPLFCLIFVYWMHTEDPLSTAFNSSEDRSGKVPVSIFGSFGETIVSLDQRKFGGGNLTEFTGSGAQMKGLIGVEFLGANSSVVVNSVFNESVSVDGVEFSCRDTLRGKVGNLSLLVVDVNLTDGAYSGTPACSPEKLVEELDGVVSRDSFGVANFASVSTIRRNLTLSGFNVSTCAYFEWARELFRNVFEFDNKTLEVPPLMGERVPDFDYIFVLFPNDTGCEWDLVSGLFHPLSVVTDCERAGHALGHNLGLGHAGDENCTEPCVVEGSLMGTGNVLNAPMRRGAGWLLPNRTLSIATNGEFVLDRLDSPLDEGLPLMISLGGGHFVSCRNDSVDVHLHVSGYPAPVFYLHSELLASLSSDGSLFSFNASNIGGVNVTADNVTECSVSVTFSGAFLLGACCVNATTCFVSSATLCSPNNTYFVGEPCDVCESLTTITTEITTTVTTTTQAEGSCCYLIFGSPSCAESRTKGWCENRPGGIFFADTFCGDFVGCCDVDDLQCRNLTFASCCVRNTSFFADSCEGGDPCDFGLTTEESSTAEEDTTTAEETSSAEEGTTSSAEEGSSAAGTTATTAEETEESTTIATAVPLPPTVPFEVWLLVPILAGVCCVLALLCVFVLRRIPAKPVRASSRRGQGRPLLG